MKKRQTMVALFLGLLAFCVTGLAASDDITTAAIDGKTADRVHLRAQASADAESLGLYFTGTEVTCAAQDLGSAWVRVTIGTQSGYMDASYLAVGVAAQSVVSQQPTGVVQTPSGKGKVNLRNGPSVDAPLKGVLVVGDPVVILGETVSKWYYLRVADVYGYASADYVKLTGALAPPSAAIPVVEMDRAMADAYLAVLQQNGTFIRQEDQQPMTLTDLLRELGEPPMEISRLMVMDPDQEGMPKVILELSAGGYPNSTLVLRYRDGVMVGYELGIRSMKEIKADGTFNYSSGAMDSGFARLIFGDDGLQIDPISYCESTENGGVTYYVDGQPATDKAFRAACDRQMAKPGAPWVDFHAANIAAMFGGR